MQDMEARCVPAQDFILLEGAARKQPLGNPAARTSHRELGGLTPWLLDVQIAE